MVRELGPSTRPVPMRTERAREAFLRAAVARRVTQDTDHPALLGQRPQRRLADPERRAVRTTENGALAGSKRSTARDMKAPVLQQVARDPRAPSDGAAMLTTERRFLATEDLATLLRVRPSAACGARERPCSKSGDAGVARAADDGGGVRSQPCANCGRQAVLEQAALEARERGLRVLGQCINAAISGALARRICVVEEVRSSVRRGSAGSRRVDLGLMERSAGD